MKIIDILGNINMILYELYKHSLKYQILQSLRFSPTQTFCDFNIKRIRKIHDNSHEKSIEV